MGLCVCSRGMRAAEVVRGRAYAYGRAAARVSVCGWMYVCGGGCDSEVVYACSMRACVEVCVQKCVVKGLDSERVLPDEDVCVCVCVSVCAFV